MLLRVCCLLSVLTCAWPSHGEIQRRAVLVSLERYPDGGTIEGAHRMSDALAERLVASFGFAPEDIHRLRDEAATKPGLFAAIDRYLVQGMDADDVAVLWFAGHGSRIQDLEDDEGDGYDEILVLWDAYDEPLVDDELPPVLSRVPALGFTVLLDCCHSGTATRGGLVGDAVLHNLFQDLPVKPRPAVAPGPAPLTVPTTYTVLSASRAEEPAVAVSSRTKGDFLVFTKALVDSLATVAPPVVYGTVLNAVRRLIVAWNYVPHGRDEVQQPQLEGPDPNRPIFASVSAAPAGAWLQELTIACDNEPLREACGPPVGGLWSTSPEQAELRVLAQPGEAWECSLTARQGRVIDRSSSPTVADAGLWLRQAIARERLLQAATRLDAPRSLSLQVSREADEMMVKASGPEGWHLVVFEILPTGELRCSAPAACSPRRARRRRLWPAHRTAGRWSMPWPPSCRLICRRCRPPTCPRRRSAGWSLTKRWSS